MSNDASALLTRAAHRAAHQPFFLAGVLAAYQEANQLDDANMAALLGCQAIDLVRLALCRRPAADPVRFVADVDHLARRFQLQGDQLAIVVRQIDALAAIQQQLQVREPGQGMLRAARDRDDPAVTDEEAPHG